MTDYTELIKLVNDCLENKHKPDPELLKKHNADPLNKDYQIKDSELVPRTDVVHDILAFLAEQMMEMNKAKHKETKGFLEYLQRRISKDIEELKNKTKIKEYYNSDFKSLFTVLRDNKEKLKKEDESDLEKEFIKSQNKLKPLIKQINDTDKLIDQIVYKLYDLTSEEIKIVEGTLK